MRTLTSRAASQGNRCSRLSLSAWLILVIAFVAAPGCEEEVRHLGKRPETRALDQTGVAVGIGEDSHEQTPLKAPAEQSGSIIGQRTADIRNAAKELQTEGAQVASTKIVKKDPITILGNAYVSIIGRTSIFSIQQAMDLYHANNDRYPKDYDEFMNEIIKANNIALPQLPPYQKYGYDERKHKLIILEYPDIKNQPALR